ncbi:MAG: hypothetical protein KBD78_06475 [Oligoflexales bacterium]|nr:hypothetical protein [Oligoflexales bacterium]
MHSCQAKLRIYFSKKKINAVANIIFMTIFSTSCGSNLFKATDTAPVEVEATRYLEDGKPEKAVSLLLNSLDPAAKAAIESGEPGTELANQIEELTNSLPDRRMRLSLLSAAYAQSYGFDPLNLILNLAAEDEEDEENPSAEEDDKGFAKLFPVLPAATDANIFGFALAQTILQAIPSEEMNSADQFKLGLLLTATLSLRTKKLDTDGDGNISLLESLLLEPSDALSILTELAAAGGALSEFAGDNDSRAQTIQAIENFQQNIDSQEGSNDTERLQRFIANGA